MIGQVIWWALWVGEPSNISRWWVKPQCLYGYGWSFLNYMGFIRERDPES